MIDEDEALKYIEKKIMLRKRAIQADIARNLYRNKVIEEVAREVEKMQKGFGKDTIDSLTVYIRNMKNERKDRAG